jgi:hypothetical protein
MITRAILLAVLASGWFAGIVHADDTPKLTGSILTTEEAVAKSGAIFIGQMVSFGRKGAAGPGESKLFGNRVKVSQNLKSNFDDRATVSNNRMTDLGEKMPVTKITYIFFIIKDVPTAPDPFTVLKIIPATRDNIAIVMKAISS